MLETRPDLAAEIATGLVEGQFRLVFQPEVELRSSAIVGVEALIRWAHPALGELEPDAFIPLAERSGLIGELGNWVIDSATAVFANWLADGVYPPVTMRINVSAGQLIRHRVIDTLRTAIDRYGVPARQLCVEITEGNPLVDVAVDVVHQLHELGVLVALDDLASGYSTLAALRRLPVDVIKIDRSLIAGIDADDRTAAIVGAILTLARQLGSTVVAEGVETEHEVTALVALGCERAQGHHLGRPMSADQLRALLPRAGAGLRPRPRPRPR